MARPDPDRATAIANRAALLGELKKHPSWEELGRIIDESRERQFRSLTKRFMGGEAVSQRVVDRMAGYFKGMEDLYSAPDRIEQKLKSALRDAELFEEGA